jgi:hypothetical protein
VRVLHWERRWAPNATKENDSGRLELSTLPREEYEGRADYIDERGPRHMYALGRREQLAMVSAHV